MTAINPNFARYIFYGVSTTPPPPPPPETEDMAGDIKWTAASAIPTGYLLCNGQALDPAIQSTLFAAIGYRYGSEASLEGVSSYKVPIVTPIIGDTLISDIFYEDDFYLTKLNDSRILAVQGTDCWIGTIDTTGILTWIPSTSLPISARYGALNTLSDGRILYVGGEDVTATPTSTCQFGTVTGDTITWVTGTPLPSPRAYAGSTLLQDGRLLLVGGHDGVAELDTTLFGEIVGDTITWTAGTSYPTSIWKPTTIKYSNIAGSSKVLSVGGYDPFLGSDTVKCYQANIVDGSTIIDWLPSSDLPYAEFGYSIEILPTGHLILVGGEAGHILIGNITDTDTIGNRQVSWIESETSYVYPARGDTCIVGNTLVMIDGNMGYRILTTQILLPIIKT